MNIQDTRAISDLFQPLELGPLMLPNRIVMAPLTRSRAAKGNVPTQLHALYYAQRASAGLIIAEATQIAPEGQGYISTPGVHSKEQVENCTHMAQKEFSEEERQNVVKYLNEQFYKFR